MHLAALGAAAAEAKMDFIGFMEEPTTMQRLFSIIVPTYNRPIQLKRCLLAFSHLQFPRDRFEVIVVDDGSPTPLDGVVAPFQSILNLQLLRQQNAGPSAARNHGADCATGRFLAFTDDDCAVAPDWLSGFAEHLQRRDDQLLGGRTLNALPRNLCASASQLILDVVQEHFHKESDSYRFFASNNMAMSAERYRQLGGFDSGFRTSEDREFCDRWRMAGWPLTYAPRAVMHHAHEMGLSKFLRQHYAYGQGAWHFHHARHQRRSGKFEVKGGFYWHCFQRASGRGGQAVGLTAMMCLWQLANAAGFFREAIAHPFRLRSAPPLEQPLRQVVGG